MPSKSDSVHMFVGPTGFGVEETLDHKRLVVHPPVRRGDIQALTKAEDVGTIAIVDGTFHSFPAVGHAEIRSAIAQGWEVWGLASLGAIRACEMRTLGMRGYGQVFRRYVEDPEFSDDEVTLVHGQEAPFRPLSEPLVHMRVSLDLLLGNEIIDAEGAQRVTLSLKQRWYGDRTLQLFEQLLIAEGCDRGAVAAHLAGFSEVRIKSHDLAGYIEALEANSLGN